MVPYSDHIHGSTQSNGILINSNPVGEMLLDGGRLTPSQNYALGSNPTRVT